MEKGGRPARTLRSQRGLARLGWQSFTMLAGARKKAPFRAPWAVLSLYLALSIESAQLFVRMPSRKPSDNGIANIGQATARVGNPSKGTMAQVENPAVDVRAAISHLDDGAPAIGLVCHAQTSAEGKRWVGGDWSVWTHWLAIGHCLTSKAVIVPIKARDAARRPCLHSSRRKSTSNDGS